MIKLLALGAKCIAVAVFLTIATDCSARDWVRYLAWLFVTVNCCVLIRTGGRI